MYVGRLVCAGKTNGKLWAGYRVSSRSFPNRHAVRLNESTVAILPKDARDLERSPYISYNCVRATHGAAVVANGSHTDLIFEKITMGYPPRDAICLGLLATDYEKDSPGTPRLAAALDKNAAYLGIVTKDGINVSALPMAENECFMVATCGKTSFSRLNLQAVSAEDIARKMYGLTFDKPVCAAGVYQAGDGFEVGAYNGP